MTESERPVVIAGNWKMYKTIPEAVAFVKELAPEVASSACRVYLAVPFTAIHPVVEAADGANITIGAQNMNDASEGAFTGEVAGKMLRDAGAQFVLIGHSERRHIFQEDNAFINRKVRRALKDDLQVVLCVGETLQEREEDKTEEVLQAQLTESLEGITAEQFSRIILAYEPVWAIGTGKTATPEEAQAAHQFCRRVIAEGWGEDVANQVVIQYGGSVKPENAGAILSQPDIDGVLVGGASLKSDTFAQIVNYQQMLTENV